MNIIVQQILKEVKVDENKAQLLIQGNGFGLNGDGEGIIQLDTKYYSAANFEKDQYVEIWVDSQVQVADEPNLPIISDVAKINFTPEKMNNLVIVKKIVCTLGISDFLFN